MSGQKLLISVLDTKTGIIVANKVETKEAAKIIGVPYKTIYNSVSRGSMIRKRYKTVEVESVVSEINMSDFEEKETWKSNFIKEWDQVFKYVQCIKSNRRISA